jgi:hypothetical protein
LLELRILVRTTASGCPSPRAARGVEAWTADGDRGAVRGRAVVAACGGPRHSSVAAPLRARQPQHRPPPCLHRATLAWGRFDQKAPPGKERCRPATRPSTRSSTPGYASSTRPPHPPEPARGLLAWRGTRHHTELMRQLAHTSGVDSASRPRGSRRPRREPVARHLSPDDTIPLARRGGGARASLRARRGSAGFSCRELIMGARGRV